MTEQQILQVKRSWRIFRQIDPHVLGGVFYEKLFAEHPSLRKMFKTSTEDQSKKLIDMLSAIVMHIDKLDEMENDIHALALRHVRYGVKSEHYRAVGDALLWTLEQGLGNDWNKDAADAWRACYIKLAGMMLQAT